ncbi:MAG TPA: POTRA domain-containing protein, partial [Bacteroidales bacterium]|nr:POTRA domain-containing protein [Bacteroidales bacterium]
MIKKISFLFYFVIISTLLSGQIIDIDYRIPQEYIIGGVTVSGIQNEESKDLIIMISNLTPGKKITIPGEDIQNAIKNLYKQGMFERIEISVISRSGSTIYLDIFIEEKSRMSSLVIEGVRKGEANTLKEKINIHSGDILTEFAISNAIDNIKKYYIDKGFNNINVKV